MKVAAENMFLFNSHNINVTLFQNSKGVKKAIDCISLIAVEMIPIQCVYDRKT